MGKGYRKILREGKKEIEKENRKNKKERKEESEKTGNEIRKRKKITK